ncbi:enhancer of mRNA decapping [Chytridiales sp. JEL 0842]|nr:enhancer of mRNA decapping [Chytridiales sp. JEL 0842]
MSSQFIGLDVRLFLKDSNTLIDGRVISIDEHTQMISLANALVNSNGSTQMLPLHYVPGANIRDLKILPPRQPPPPQLPPPSSSSSSNMPGAVPTQQPNLHHPQQHLPHPHPVPSLAAPTGHIPPLQSHLQTNLPAPAPGQIPLPPNTILHHGHHGHQQGLGPQGYHHQSQAMGQGGHVRQGGPVGGAGGMQMGGGDHAIMKLAGLSLGGVGAAAAAGPPAPKATGGPLPFDPAIVSGSPSKATATTTTTTTTGTNTSPKNKKKSIEAAPPSKLSTALQRQQQQQARISKKTSTTKQQQPDTTEEEEEEYDFNEFNNLHTSSQPPQQGYSASSSTGTVTESNHKRTDTAGSTKKKNGGAEKKESVQERGMYAYQHLNGKTVNAGGAGGALVKAKGSKSGKGEKVSRRHETTRSPSRGNQQRRHRRTEPFNQWANDDVDCIDDDFDFQASLALFDKSQVFAEIRESDMTDPETLLVSHNRMSGSNGGVKGNTPGAHAYVPTAPKLGIRQMVLEPDSKDGAQLINSGVEDEGDETGNDAEVEESEDAMGGLVKKPNRHTSNDHDDDDDDDDDDSDDERWGLGLEDDEEEEDFREVVTPTMVSLAGASAMLAAALGLGPSSSKPKTGSVGLVKAPSSSTRSVRRPVFLTGTGLQVPSVLPIEMEEVERLASAETGPNEEQMIENGGRGVAMMVLQVLGGSRRIKPGNHNSAPTVVVMAGNNKTGAYGLCAARHLANHEVNVIVCAVGEEAEQSNTVAYQRKIYMSTGRLVKDLTELPHNEPVDLIIDSLLGSYQSILDLSVEYDKPLVCALIKWANDNKANVLSLDVPSGVNPISGLPMSPSHYIEPKWTLAFGLPKTGLGARSVIGELLLADIGIPRIVYKRVGGRGNSGGVGGAGGHLNQGVGRTFAFARRYVPPFGDKYVVPLTRLEAPAVGGVGVEKQ